MTYQQQFMSFIKASFVGILLLSRCQLLCYLFACGNSCVLPVYRLQYICIVFTKAGECGQSVALCLLVARKQCLISSKVNQQCACLFRSVERETTNRADIISWRNNGYLRFSVWINRALCFIINFIVRK